MATTFLTLTNELLRRLNEVTLTTSTFATAKNVQAIAKDAINSSIREILQEVELGTEILNNMPSELSGGMQKRVALARAIINKPNILFFDEPTTGLDPISADVINKLIIEKVRDIGATSLTITHDMSSARTISDKIHMLHKGEIIWEGNKDTIESTDNPFVVQFINGLSEGPIN